MAKESRQQRTIGVHVQGGHFGPQIPAHGKGDNAEADQGQQPTRWEVGRWLFRLRLHPVGGVRMAKKSSKTIIGGEKK